MRVSETIAAYNRYHKIYHRETEGFWARFPGEVVSTFVKSLSGEEVLNIGSGGGWDAMLLKGAGLKVTCLDAAEEMVRRTRELGFTTVLADMREMEFDERSFDGVWAYTSLLHLSEPEVVEVLKKINKIIKKDGCLLLGMIEGFGEKKVARKTMPGVKRYFYFYSEGELREIVEKAGFEMCYQGVYQPKTTRYLNQIYVKI
jgi:SAM-dependent methyltransferase